MAQRIFVSCRSNHDPIDIGNLACQTLLGRNYLYEDDYLRFIGDFGRLKTSYAWGRGGLP